jgi:Zn ribbon nucleic-acid-binding protein
MSGDKGKNGAIGICPKCSNIKYIRWDPETDVSTCLNCGWNNEEQIKEQNSRIKLQEIIDKYGLTLWSTANTAKGKSYQYMDFDGINVIINDWDKSFQFKWLVPKSIMTIECPTCSPYDYPNHFDRTYKRFQEVVCVYKCGLNYM